MSHQIHRWLKGEENKPLRSVYKKLEAHLLDDCDYCIVYEQYRCILSEHTSKYQFLQHIGEVTKVLRDVEKHLIALHKKEMIQYDVITDKLYSILFLKLT